MYQTFVQICSYIYIYIQREREKVVSILVEIFRAFTYNTNHIQHTKRRFLKYTCLKTLVSKQVVTLCLALWYYLYSISLYIYIFIKKKSMLGVTRRYHIIYGPLTYSCLIYFNQIVSSLNLDRVQFMSHNRPFGRTQG